MSHSFALAEPIRPSMLLETSRQMAMSMFLAAGAVSAAASGSAALHRSRAAAHQACIREFMAILLFRVWLRRVTARTERSTREDELRRRYVSPAASFFTPEGGG